MPDDAEEFMPKRAKEALAKRRAAEKRETIALPTWAEPVAGVPNELIRSALFAAVDGHSRRTMRLEKIASQGDLEILFTGAQLTQGHLDVFDGIMHLSRGVFEGDLVEFSAHELLKLIGRRTSGREHEWLYGMIVDLTACAISIHHSSGRLFFGSIIANGAEIVDRGGYKVLIMKQLVKIFRRGFTHVQWDQRRRLKQKPLACWLLMYYSSHLKPLPVTVDFLRRQSGSNIAELRFFRRNLKAALDEIKEVGAIGDWFIDAEDKVVVDRLSVAEASSRA